MLYFSLHLSIMNTIVSVSYAEYRHEAQTIAGIFKIEELYPVEEFYFHVFLDQKIIYRLDMPYVDIEEKYDLKDRTLIVLHFGYGGAATTPNYAIVDISSEITTMSKKFFSKTQVPTFTLKKDRIEFDLGFESGLRKSGIYHNGALEIEKTTVTEKNGDQESCRYLYYQMYTTYVEKQECTLPFMEILGLSSERYLRAMRHDPHFQIDLLDALAKKSCVSQKKLSFPTFQKKICTMK